MHLVRVRGARVKGSQVLRDAYAPALTLPLTNPNPNPNPKAIGPWSTAVGGDARPLSPDGGWKSGRAFCMRDE